MLGGCAELRGRWEWEEQEGPWLGVGWRWRWGAQDAGCREEGWKEGRTGPSWRLPRSAPVLTRRRPGVSGAWSGQPDSSSQHPELSAARCSSLISSCPGKRFDPLTALSWQGHLAGLRLPRARARGDP